MSDALLLLLRVNLAAGAAVALTMLLRRPVRRLFGPRVAYGLWTSVPLFSGAMLLPARVVTMTRAAAPDRAGAASSFSGFAGPAFAPVPFDASRMALAIWIVGALAALAGLVWSQVQFGRAMRGGRAGPAVVGVIRPRVVVPDDFAQRYTPREQRVVLAHEQTHIARQDSRINALVSLARCLAWFNPLAHLMARELRIDQELACDAQVVAAHPATRRSYAEAMLKTQLAGRPLPLGCYWPAPAAHPLAERIALLSRRSPSRAGRGLGGALVMLIAAGGAYGAWAARPAHLVLVEAPARPLQTPRVADGPAPASPTPPAPIAPPSRPALERVSVTSTPATEAPAAQEPSLAPSEAANDPAADGPTRRLLPPGLFGSRRVHALASWSSVEPGYAVRVLATMVDPDGAQLTTDLTSFGSQSRYRLGYIERNFSRYKLFTTVRQHGDRLEVTAGLNQAFSPMKTASIDLASGETGTIRLPEGLLVTVTPTLRPETPEEVAEGRGRARIDVLRERRPS